VQQRGGGGRDLDGDGFEQGLRHDLRRGPLEAEGLVQHPLVRGVLVNQVQPVRPLGHDIGRAHLPNHAQQRHWLGGE